MEIKQNTTPIIYVKLIDSSTDSDKTGVINPSVFFSVAGGISTQVSSPTFSEVDSTNMPGIYKLTLTSAMTASSGELIISVYGTGTDKYTAKYDIVSAKTPDVKTVVDAIKTTTDTNLDAKVSTRSTVTESSIWNTLTNTMTVTGSIGKKLIDSLNDTLANLNTEINQVANETWVSSSRSLTNTSTLETNVINGIFNKLTSSLTTPNSFGKLIVDYLNASITSRASQTDADIIKAQTNKLTFDSNNKVSANATATIDPTQIANAVLDATASQHNISGTIGEKINSENSSIIETGLGA